MIQLTLEKQTKLDNISVSFVERKPKPGFAGFENPNVSAISSKTWQPNQCL